MAWSEYLLEPHADASMNGPSPTLSQDRPRALQKGGYGLQQNSSEYGMGSVGALDQTQTAPPNYGMTAADAGLMKAADGSNLDETIDVLENSAAEVAMQPGPDLERYVQGVSNSQPSSVRGGELDATHSMPGYEAARLQQRQDRHPNSVPSASRGPSQGSARTAKQSNGDPQLDMIHSALQQREVQVAFAEKDAQIAALTEMVEEAKISMQDLCDEADGENAELHNELEAAQAELEAAREDQAAREIASSQVSRKLAESEAMCEALRWELEGVEDRLRQQQEEAENLLVGNWGDQRETMVREAEALKKEAALLQKLTEGSWQQKSSAYEQISLELKDLRAQLDREQEEEERADGQSWDVSGFFGGSRRWSRREQSHSPRTTQTTAPGSEDTEALQGVSSSGNSLESRNKQSTDELVKFLKAELTQAVADKEEMQLVEERLKEECETYQEEVRAEMAEAERRGPNAAQLEIQAEASAKALVDAQNAAVEARRLAFGARAQNGWTRLVLRTCMNDTGELKAAQDAWAQGNKGWQALSAQLILKVQNLPSSRFAQDIERHCAKGDAKLAEMEKRFVNEGKNMANAVRSAMSQFVEAQRLMQDKLQDEKQARCAAEERIRQLENERQARCAAEERIRQLENEKQARCAAEERIRQLENEKQARCAAEERVRQLEDENRRLAEAQRRASEKEAQVVNQLMASVDQERAEVDRLNQKLQEAEQTIGLLVIEGAQ
eukprot:TRINITY_DN5117_c0_g1_i4.p1 TRINITY_DN5117_c0_g1~~TRINITY_DN5117_c0_g1_i4.p1  ORF type:complete len:728 (-),score=191.95 TRINITY_DN5117_c0_g1_i4:180-2363(-)